MVRGKAGSENQRGKEVIVSQAYAADLKKKIHLKG